MAAQILVVRWHDRAKACRNISRTMCSAVAAANKCSNSSNGNSLKQQTSGHLALLALLTWVVVSLA
jgi:hypothetical protein